MASENKDHDKTKSNLKSGLAPKDTLYSVLIVDDNTTFQQLSEFSLRTLPRIGIIDFADDGEIALAKANERQYDIIFMDAMMPNMDGYQASHLLRELPGYKHTPIIMVSGLTSPIDEVKGIIAGSTTYVTKPLQQKPFLELVNRVIAWLDL